MRIVSKKSIKKQGNKNFFEKVKEKKKEDHNSFKIIYPCCRKKYKFS